MEFEQALAIADAAVFEFTGRHLNDVETAILKGSWHRQTYEQIADASSYSISYLTRDVGPKLWKLLAQALGEPVSKTSFQTALERRGQTLAIETYNQQEGENSDRPAPATLRIDWGEAINVNQFQGRQAELAQLSHWLLEEKCRLVALLGLGGVGKSSLAAKLANELALAAETGSHATYTHLIWRSLRNAPPLETLLSELVLFVSNQTETRADLKQLLHWLRTHRCLVILDNVETILQAGDRAGQYRSGYENYGGLFQALGEGTHQSCLLMTSREKPAEIAAMEGLTLEVRSLALKGEREIAQAILTAKGLIGTQAQRQLLCDRYDNNPLALKIVASSIQELFGGKIEPFLDQDTVLFNGVRRLLQQQFERLSPLEQAVMYWLAINREWTSVLELEEDLMPPVSRSRLLEALESLSWRNLIEKCPGSYTLQPVVMEYVCDRLVEKMTAELRTSKLNQFNRFALLKTTVKDYIRDSQKRLILGEIINRLQGSPELSTNLEEHFKNLLNSLRQSSKTTNGYSGGNLLNFLSYLNENLSDSDCSGLIIRHAYLAKTLLHNVNFANSEFDKTVFTQPFSSVLSVAFHPKEPYLAVGLLSGRILLWSTTTGKLINILSGHHSWVWSVAWSASGRFLISGSADLQLRLWDYSTSRCLKMFRGHQGPIFSVAWSPTEEIIASGSCDLTIKLWDTTTEECLLTLSGHTHPVHDLAWSPDGRYLASASADHTLKIWDIETGHCQTTLTGHQGALWTVDWSPDGNYLASGGDDHAIYIWSTDTGQLLQLLHGHGNSVWKVNWNVESQLLVSGSWDGSIKFWRVAAGECTGTIHAHRSGIWSVALSPDEQ